KTIPPQKPTYAGKPTATLGSTGANVGFHTAHAADEPLDIYPPPQPAPDADTNPRAPASSNSLATADGHRHRDVRVPPFSSSVRAHTTIAVDAAVLVLRNTSVASGLALSALPALKPNHPVQSNPAPTRQSGRLCGGIGSLPRPRRLPSKMAAAMAEKPLDM